MGFVHLHNHTQYSVLDGACRTDRIAKVAKEMGMSAVAMTDHGNLFGAVDFFKECNKAGVKPILGSEVYIVENDFDHPGTKDDERYHLVLLVKNKIGYKNLIKLSSISFTEGFHAKPRINRTLLRTYSEGLICLSACVQGEIPSKLLKKSREEAMEALQFYKEIFGDNFYIELQNHDLENERTVMPQLIELARETNTQMVVTNDCHYLYRSDATAHDYLLCIQTGKSVTEEDRLKYPATMYFKSEEEMSRLFPGIPEAIENTVKIADQIDFKLAYDDFLLPKVEIPEEFASDIDYLRNLCFSMVTEKYPEMTPEIEKRINHELRVITEMGFASYFLVVKDLIDSSRARGIIVGPGRGSAAGSIVAYLLDITRIDPLKYNLLFERFLNSERVEMPDIDIDFCAHRRSEVIDYVIEKYGRESVTQIITFGTLGAKSVIKDIARVMGIPPGESNALTKLMSSKSNVNLEQHLKDQKEFEQKIKENPKYQEIYENGKVIEGLIRQIGVHAAGVVIGPGDLSEYVPLSTSNQKDGDPVVLVQYEGKWLNDLKMLKMDILGINTLSIIQKALELIKKYRNIDIDIDKIDLSDEKTFDLLSKGQTDGIFQLESSGMKKYLRELKPNDFEDIVAITALYRPGPLQYIDSFINRKHGNERIVYDHPLVEDALRESYGINIYQEQVMRISRSMGGLSGFEAEKLRKAMGKKDISAMMPLKEKFIAGSIENGVNRSIIDKIWASWEKFAEYAFNKSHSVCYSFVAFQTAYLKAHYPIEYMTALLSLEDTTAKIPLYVEDARKMGIELLLPSINNSDSDFKIIDNKILYGLGAIKNVGVAAISAILTEREENGPFEDYFTFVKRVVSTAMNKAVLEALIKSGALDDFEGSRAQKFAAIDNALYLASTAQAVAKSGQMTFFDFQTEEERIKDKPEFPKIPEWDFKTILDNEKSILGFYFSGHPLEEERHLIKCYTNIDTKEATLENVIIPEKIKIIGMIKNIEIKRTKKKDTDYFVVSLEDLYGKFEMTLFEKQIEKYSQLIIPNKKLFIIGTQNAFQGNSNEKMLKINPVIILPIEEINTLKGSLLINMHEDDATIEFANSLLKRCSNKSGNLHLAFNIKKRDSQKVNIESKFLTITPDKDFVNEIYEKRKLDLESLLEKEKFEPVKERKWPKYGSNY